MIQAIAEHRATWQAFQDAPDEPEGSDGYREALRAESVELDVIEVLLRTAPADQDDLAALKAHLDWYVVEEEQRREITPGMFALHAAINLARGCTATFSRHQNEAIWNPDGSVAERPAGISEDIWLQLTGWDETIPHGDELLVSPIVLARAIQAERDRCRRIALREKGNHGESGAVACLEIALGVLNGDQP